MSYTLSPSVSFREIDLTASAVARLANNGSLAGKFRWGPVNERVRVASESQLVAAFGTPSDDNFKDFYLATSFLAYSNALDVVRIGAEGVVKNAVDTGAAVSVLNEDDYAANVPTTTSFFAKYPGALGNSLQVITCGTADQYQMRIPGTFGFTISKTVTYTPAAAEVLTEYFQVGDILVVDGSQYEVGAVAAAQLTLNKVFIGATTARVANDAGVLRRWKFANNFSSAPGTNEFQMVVVDEDGLFTNEAGSILETFVLSTDTAAKYDDGSSKFYKTAIAQKSVFIRAGDLALTFGAGDKTADRFSLSGGDDAFGSLTLADYIAGYDLFKNREEVNAPLIIGGGLDTGDSNATLANYIIQNICEVRKDGVAFFSPAYASVATKGQQVALIIADRNKLPSTSYGIMDSGWKYIYDRYNNKYRWIPTCADHAGLYARVDVDRETWFSAAGTERGLIKNCIRLAFTPDETQRDQLYPIGVNPVAVLPGVGPVMYGDKTLLNKDSAFNRINVRRLFIVLEVTLTRAAENLLFEFNDEITQRRFVSIAEPFLNSVKGRRGLEDYRVIADDTVNTPAVKQSNSFVGQIFVRPLYSINWIRLDFVAVGASSSFDEVIGQF